MSEDEVSIELSNEEVWILIANEGSKWTEDLLGRDWNTLEERLDLGKVILSFLKIKCRHSNEEKWL